MTKLEQVKTILPPQYDQIKIFSSYSLALVLKKKQLILVHIDKSQPSIHLGKYSPQATSSKKDFSSQVRSQVRLLSEDFMALKQGNNWGVFSVTALSHLTSAFLFAVYRSILVPSICILTSFG